MTDEKINNFTWNDIKNKKWNEISDKQTIGDLSELIIDMNKDVEENKNKIKDIYIEIIQVITLVVAVLALILGNLVGYNTLPTTISPNELIGYLFIINAITLTGITFLMFMIKFLFLKSKWNCYYSIFLIPIVTFYLIGFALIL